MESFRLVCRDGRGEWYMHDVQAENALAAFEAAAVAGRMPHVVVPDRLGRGIENAVVQRWRQGGTELGDCLNCGYELKGLVRAADGLAICPECGVGAVMKTPPSAQVSPINHTTPIFQSGAMLETWGIAFALLGILFLWMSFAGIAMGVLAYELSTGRRGKWAMRLGTLMAVVGFIKLYGGVHF